MGLTTQALSEANWSDFEALLAPANGCDGCWCYNHHIQPGDPDVTGDEARLAKRALVVAGKALGVLAYDDGEPAGWCAVDLPDDIPGHDCVEPGAAPAHRWSVHCFYVRPESRGRGVSRALLEAAEALARSRGATSLEGYPTRPGAEIFDFSGPWSLFERRGYEVCDDVGPWYCRVVQSLRDG